MADPARKLHSPAPPTAPANDTTEAPLPAAVERAFVDLLVADLRRRPPRR